MVIEKEVIRRLELITKEEVLFKTVPQTLAMFPSLKSLQLAQLLSILPPQKPVYYSIASSSVCSPEAVRLVVGKNLFLNGTMEGLCSSYLIDRVKVGQRVEGHINPSSFRLPEGVFVVTLCCVCFH